MPLKILVTGYPRGATRWAYRVLKSAGCNVGFCSVFTENSNNQYTYKAVAEASVDIEVSWFSAPFIYHPALQDVNIVRLERHPLLVANSLSWLGAFSPAHNTHMAKWYSIMSRHVGGLESKYKDCPGQSSLHFVCAWARKILQLSQHGDTCVKVEDGEYKLLIACGETCAKLEGIVPSCNGSGCPAVADAFGLGDNDAILDMRRLLVERNYSDMNGDERAWLGAYPTGLYVPSGV